MSEEKFNIQLDHLKEGLQEIKGTLREKADKDDVAATKREVTLNIDNVKENLSKGIKDLSDEVETKVPKKDFHSVKIIYGTILTGFSAYIVTQIAKIIFGGH